jgi:hypothetical protein
MTWESARNHHPRRPTARATTSGPITPAPVGAGPAIAPSSSDPMTEWARVLNAALATAFVIQAVNVLITVR